MKVILSLSSVILSLSSVILSLSSVILSLSSVILSLSKGDKCSRARHSMPSDNHDVVLSSSKNDRDERRPGLMVPTIVQRRSRLVVPSTRSGTTNVRRSHPSTSSG
jgi:hypothetical protein